MQKCIWAEITNWNIYLDKIVSFIEIEKLTNGIYFDLKKWKFKLINSTFLQQGLVQRTSSVNWSQWLCLSNACDAPLILRGFHTPYKHYLGHTFNYKVLAEDFAHPIHSMVIPIFYTKSKHVTIYPHSHQIIWSLVFW